MKVHDTERRAEPTVFEIDGQTYRAGDWVLFQRAGTRRNRSRRYQVTDTSADGITVTVDGCTYRLSRSDIDTLGITHANQ